MGFGEIVEPSTRALLYDEDEFTIQENLNWEQEYEISETINLFLITETPFTNKIIQTVLIGNKQPIAKTAKNIITIYRFDNSKYIALCNPTPNTSIGQVSEKLLPWIKAANKCYSLLTLPTSSYQNKAFMERPFCMLRMLTTIKDDMQLCPKLETPNLVTGIGANCLSYCIYAKQNCSLFIGYLDYAPIDSVNAKPFIDLLKQIGFDSYGKMYKQTDKLPQNNLYI